MSDWFCANPSAICSSKFFFGVSHICIYKIVRMTAYYTNADTDTQMDTCIHSHTLNAPWHRGMYTHENAYALSHATYIHTHAPVSIWSIRRADFHLADYFLLLVLVSENAFHCMIYNESHECKWSFRTFCVFLDKFLDSKERGHRNTKTRS